MYLFNFKVCGARVKTKDTLKQHRKKLHNLTTPVPKTALINEDTTGVILPDQRQAGATGMVVGLSHTEERIVGINSIGNINSVSPLISVLPKL